MDTFIKERIELFRKKVNSGEISHQASNGFILIKTDRFEAFLQESLEEYGKKIEKKYEDIFRWLQGYTDFPPRKEEEGNYWWRKELRRKLNDLKSDTQTKE